ncbi:Gfo/Idh/MocA family oxidoreductase [Rarobacter faecitabidus]|uniref:Putative dehydrogenase n=1 Tax=Rarobacter faecitabidus TaxID=13243 RepID=A0A542ZTH8_RARFA|nr:Gfo/Idh/MocA family oxidoreductase [Rarobacter faecitabidus]TQL63651.1 putative dehydrogenase [Rarobacter faecitabidus]
MYASAIDALPTVPAANKSALPPDPATAPAIRWGVLGAGGIARMFARAIQHHTVSNVTAVGSRSLEKAASFAQDFHMPRIYGSYEELVASDDIDVVYVASPHSHHREHALLALEAGKPVLVEKAFTRNTGEALDIFQLAASKGLFVMEAMWTRFLPATSLVHEIIASGQIGEVVAVLADHGQKLDHDAAGRLLNPALAGGALLDLGVYPIAYAIDILGALARVSAVGKLTETGVDGNVSLVLDYPGKRQASLNTTLWAKTATTAVVAGTKAWIEVPGDFYCPASIRLHLPDGLTKEISTGFPPGHAGLAYEAAEVARCLSAGQLQSGRNSWRDTLAVMATLDEARQQVGVVYPGE